MIPFSANHYKDQTTDTDLTDITQRRYNASSGIYFASFRLYILDVSEASKFSMSTTRSVYETLYGGCFA